MPQAAAKPKPVEEVTLESLDRKMTRIETRLVKLMYHLGADDGVTGAKDKCPHSTPAKPSR
jgi:hypothetical protein